MGNFQGQFPEAKLFRAQPPSPMLDDPIPEPRRIHPSPEPKNRIPVSPSQNPGDNEILVFLPTEFAEIILPKKTAELGWKSSNAGRFGRVAFHHQQFLEGEKKITSASSSAILPPGV
jgi:hypothetical protein